MAKNRWMQMAFLLMGILCVLFIVGCITPWGKKQAQPVVKQQPPPPTPSPKPAPPPPPPQSPKPQPKEEVKAPPPPPEPNYIEHVVRWSGETLGIISKWYTGNFSNWKLIAEANPALNPERMRKGNIIKIPKELLKTQEPMPKSFVDKFYKKEEEEPVLFGPKK